MRKIKLENAMQAINMIVDVAKKDKGLPVAIAITNINGIVIAAAVMDEAPERVVRIAELKAYTAAKMRISTLDFLKRLRDERLQIEWFGDGSFSPLPGGVPIYVQNLCIGAVGISGRELYEDVRLAEICADFLISL